MKLLALAAAVLTVAVAFTVGDLLVDLITRRFRT